MSNHNKRKIAGRVRLILEFGLLSSFAFVSTVRRARIPELTPTYAYG